VVTQLRFSTGMIWPLREGRSIQGKDQPVWRAQLLCPFLVERKPAWLQMSVCVCVCVVNVDVCVSVNVCGECRCVCVSVNVCVWMWVSMYV
jgi:hypothetical protein